MASTGWPQGKTFAFSIFDDTDNATLDNIQGVYSFLLNLGFRVTKSVWPLKGNELAAPGKPFNRGVTCEDPQYVLWLIELQKAGCEIGHHSTTCHRSERQRIIEGLERFRTIFGHYPKTMAQHCEDRENDSIYWGSNRVTGLNRRLYNLLTRNRHHNISRGHCEGSQFFWGDLCREKIKYVRNFVFSDINTLKACPDMPYHDPKKPHVNYWFASSEGPKVESFNRCLSEQNQDRLEAEGGACIMYTHFANGFWQNKRLNPRFEQLMKRLNHKNGWFVPVGELLDHLLQAKGHREITYAQRKQLELRWLWHKVRTGSS